MQIFSNGDNLNEMSDPVFCEKYKKNIPTLLSTELLASVAQLDAPSVWRQEGRGFIPHRGQQHSFMEIDREIFSTVILSLPRFKKGSCQFLAKECAPYWLTS